MNWVKRAWISIIRNPFKSFALFIVIFTVGLFAVASMSIYLSTNQLKDEIKQRLGPKATIYSSINQDTHFPSNYEKEFINYVNILEELSKEDSVSYTNINCFLKGFQTNDIYDGEIYDIKTYKDEGSLPLKVDLFGTNYSQPIESIENKINLVDGRFFSDNEISQPYYGVLVSTDYKKNDGTSIHTGDYISFYYEKNNEIIYNFIVEVIGVFQEINSLPTDTLDLSKQIIMPNKTIYQISQYLNESWVNLGNDLITDSEYHINQLGIKEPIFKLKSNDDLETFNKKAEKLVSNTNFKYVSTNDIYEANAGILENISVMSRVLLICSFLSSFIILCIAFIIFIRFKKKEIGIYVSIGEKKANIIMQQAGEILLISLLAINLSILGGFKVANNISNEITYFLTDPNIEIAHSENTLLNPEGINKDKIIQEYEIRINSQIIIMIEVTVIVIVLLSMIIPIYYIFKIKPKDLFL